MQNTEHGILMMMSMRVTEEVHFEYVSAFGAAMMFLVVVCSDPDHVVAFYWPSRAAHNTLFRVGGDHHWLLQRAHFRHVERAGIEDVNAFHVT